MDAELECISASTGKAEGLGPLVGGSVFSVSLGFARRLLMSSGGGVEVLDLLGKEGLAFETAVGRNGRVWVSSEDVRTVVVVGRALTETDERSLEPEDQKKLVRRLLKETR
jgi:exosome complex component RRP40